MKKLSSRQVALRGRRVRFVEKFAVEIYESLRTQVDEFAELEPELDPWNSAPNRTRKEMFFLTEEILDRYGLKIDDPDAWNRLAEASETEPEFVLVSRHDLHSVLSEIVLWKESS